jgi:YHS domain-containing protein
LAEAKNYVGEGQPHQTLGLRRKRQLRCCEQAAGKFCTTEVIMTQDPVCGMNVDEKNAELQVQVAGKKYFFCSEECKKEFQEKPEDYVETAA